MLFEDLLNYIRIRRLAGDLVMLAESGVELIDDPDLVPPIAPDDLRAVRAFLAELVPGDVELDDAETSDRNAVRELVQTDQLAATLDGRDREIAKLILDEESLSDALAWSATFCAAVGAIRAGERTARVDAQLDSLGDSADEILDALAVLDDDTFRVIHARLGFLS